MYDSELEKRRSWGKACFAVVIFVLVVWAGTFLIVAIQERHKLIGKPDNTVAQYNYHYVRSYVAIAQFVDDAEKHEKDILDVLQAAQGNAILALPTNDGTQVKFCHFDVNQVHQLCTKAIWLKRNTPIGGILMNQVPLSMSASGSSFTISTEFEFTKYMQ